MTDRPKRLRVWGIAAASLLATVALAELLVRLLLPAEGLPAPAPPSTIDPYAPNPYIVSRRPYLQMFLPGARYRAQRPSYLVDYEINAHGLRGPEIDPKEDRRLLIVGDSIPEGHGVPFEQSFPPRLDRTLDDAGWSVTSGAMQGGSPLHYAANLPRYLELDPDAVLLLLYENDLWEDRRREAEYFDLPPIEEDAGSRLWSLARRSMRPPADSDLERHVRVNRDTKLPAVEPDPITPIVVAPEVFDQQWEMTAPYLDALADGLEREDVPLLVAVFALGTLVPRAPDAHHAHARTLEGKVRAWCDRRGVPFLSLYPVSERAFEGLAWEDIMIPEDGHPTAEMQRRLAAALEPWLRENLD